MLRSGTEVVTKKGLKYIVEDGRVKRSKPWLGDLFSFAYDFFMEKFIFPGKFGSDMDLHFRILSRELEAVSGKNVLELAAGSGSAVHFLSNDNRYTGTDISPGLLKKAVKNFRNAGFRNAEFYVTGCESLPFEDNSFDACLCVLAFNFLNNPRQLLAEVNRMLKDDGSFLCCVPVSDRMKEGSKIEGTLYSEEQLADMFSDTGFVFEELPDNNGSVFYFKARILS